MKWPLRRSARDAAPEERRRGGGSDIDWNGRLEPGEQLLWSGRPDAGERPLIHPVAEPAARWTLALVCVGLVLLLFHTLLPAIGGDPLSLSLVVAMAAVLLFGAWYMLGGQARWNRYWLARTRYALTDRRAVIARRAFRRYWTVSVPVTRMTPATLVDLGGVGHVMFRQFRTAVSYSTISKGMSLSPRHYATGFLFLREARLVHRRLVRLQSAASEEVQARIGPVA